MFRLFGCSLCIFVAASTGCGPNEGEGEVKETLPNPQIQPEAPAEKPHPELAIEEPAPVATKIVSDRPSDDSARIQSLRNQRDQVEKGIADARTRGRNVEGSMLSGALAANSRQDFEEWARLTDEISRSEGISVKVSDFFRDPDPEPKVKTSIVSMPSEMPRDSAAGPSNTGPILVFVTGSVQNLGRTIRPINGLLKFKPGDGKIPKSVEDALVRLSKGTRSILRVDDPEDCQATCKALGMECSRYEQLWLDVTIQ